MQVRAWGGDRNYEDVIPIMQGILAMWSPSSNKVDGYLVAQGAEAQDPQEPSSRWKEVQLQLQALAQLVPQKPLRRATGVPKSPGH
jgi:hypothetical protein